MTEHAREAREDNSVAAGDIHPAKYQRDMNPEAMAGQNWGLEGPHPEKTGTLTANDIKDFHQRYPEYTNDELQQIIILPAGHRLEQGATYLDLASSHPEEIKATGDMVVQEHNWFVPKSETDYQLWNRRWASPIPNALALLPIRKRRFVNKKPVTNATPPVRCGVCFGYAC
jgi:hypothetical protein